MDKTPYINHIAYLGANNDRTPLKTNNIQKRLSALEKGANLFEVIPEIKKLKSFQHNEFGYAFFETQSYAMIEGELLQGKLKRNGSFLIPQRKIISKRNLYLLSQIYLKKLPSSHQKICLKALDKYPEADLFYGNGVAYKGFHSSQVLLLTINQL